MSRNIQPVTGMKDVLQAEIGVWQHVERAAASVLAAYGYGEDDVDPIVEGALRQQRLLAVSPRPATAEDLASIVRESMEP